jgi:hypothetical protein
MTITVGIIYLKMYTFSWELLKYRSSLAFLYFNSNEKENIVNAL